VRCKPHGVRLLVVCNALACSAYVAYTVFRSEDIGREICGYVAKSAKKCGV